MTFVFTSPWNFYLNPKYFLFVSFFFEVRTYNCYCLKGNVFIFFHSIFPYFGRNTMLQYSNSYSTYLQIFITCRLVRAPAWKCGNWKQQQRVILSMSAYQNSKETVGHYFERISVVFFFFIFFFALMFDYIRYQWAISSKSDYLKVESFCFLLIAGST